MAGVDGDAGIGPASGGSGGGMSRTKTRCRRRFEPPRLDSAGEEGEGLEAALPIVFDLREEDLNTGDELGNPAAMEELVRGKRTSRG